MFSLALSFTAPFHLYWYLRTRDYGASGLSGHFNRLDAWYLVFTHLRNHISRPQEWADVLTLNCQVTQESWNRILWCQDLTNGKMAKIIVAAPLLIFLKSPLKHGFEHFLMLYTLPRTLQDTTLCQTWAFPVAGKFSHGHLGLICREYQFENHILHFPSYMHQNAKSKHTN